MRKRTREKPFAGPSITAGVVSLMSAISRASWSLATTRPRQSGCTGPLAINIKADGLQTMLAEALSAYDIRNYFVFDMSVPDALGYLKADLRTFTRQSEYEREPAFLDRATGVWLDAFHSPWADAGVIRAHLAASRPVALVSPELHRRAYLEDWARWRDLDQRAGGGNLLMICTDFPDEAEQFFHG
jgi:hypothetical protein